VTMLVVWQGSAVRSFPLAVGGGNFQESTRFSMRDSLLKIVKEEKETHYDYDDESIQYHYSSKYLLMTRKVMSLNND